MHILRAARNLLPRNSRPFRAGVACRGLHPTTLAPPTMPRERNALAGGALQTTPVERVSEGIKRAERSQHHRAFFFLTPHRGQHDTFMADMVEPLLDST